MSDGQEKATELEARVMVLERVLRDCLTELANPQNRIDPIQVAKRFKAILDQLGAAGGNES